MSLVWVAAEPAWAAFPGENGKIAFMSDRDGNEEVYAMNSEGSGQTNLTNNRAIDLQPAISPDGNDTLRGGSGNDRLFGQRGRDRLNTKDEVQANDLADGGVGRDICETDSLSHPSG